jgi:hypothetical protein
MNWRCATIAIDHRDLPAVGTASALIRAVRTAGSLLWTIATLGAKKILACPDNIYKANGRKKVMKT